MFECFIKLYFALVKFYMQTELRPIWTLKCKKHRNFQNFNKRFRIFLLTAVPSFAFHKSINAFFSSISCCFLLLPFLLFPLTAFVWSFIAFACLFSIASRSFLISLRKFSIKCVALTAPAGLVGESISAISNNLPYSKCRLLHLSTQFFLNPYSEKTWIQILTFSLFSFSTVSFTFLSISDIILISNCFLDFDGFPFTPTNTVNYNKAQLLTQDWWAMSHSLCDMTNFCHISLA